MRTRGRTCIRTCDAALLHAYESRLFNRSFSRSFVAFLRSHLDDNDDYTSPPPRNRSLGKVLKHMKKLGVDILNLRNERDLFEKGEKLLFHGFEIAADTTNETTTIDEIQEKQGTTKKKKNQDTNNAAEDEDDRVFVPYLETGKLAFATDERFFATTEKPLPEGLCGGPVMDDFGTVSGVVEGIVPKTHEDPRVAGAAVFIPSILVQKFVDYAELIMLKSIFPEDAFRKVVQIKEDQQSYHEGEEFVLGDDKLNQRKRRDTEQLEGDDALDEAFKQKVRELKKYHDKDEVRAILNTIEREAREIEEIYKNEGGSIQEISDRVRKKTFETHQEIVKKIEVEVRQEAKEAGMSFEEYMNLDGAVDADKKDKQDEEKKQD